MIHTPITQTFLHVPGIGPKTEAKLKSQGYSTWDHILKQSEDLPLGPQTLKSLLETLKHSRIALANNDINYFVEHVPMREQWRILAAYFDQLAYFDIETSGLSYDAYVTCVVCYYQGKLFRFVHDENLDDFLELLEEIPLLVSFNGSSFDIPMLLRTWHIPAFPCPHIDLRWQCYHDQKRGGLKQIERELGIQRPADLEDVDGAEAVWLWFRWKQYQETEAREKLLRYCAADVVTLLSITATLLQNRDIAVTPPHLETLWKLL